MFDEVSKRLSAFWLSIRLTYRLLLDQRVPMWTKAVPLLTVLYLVSPLDVIPDFLLVLGQLDDLFILSLGFSWFEQLAPPDVVAEHREQLMAEMGQQDTLEQQ